jgi:hypothetical protein
MELDDVRDSCGLRFWRVAGYPAMPVASENVGFGNK